MVATRWRSTPLPLILITKRRTTRLLIATTASTMDTRYMSDVSCHVAGLQPFVQASDRRAPDIPPLLRRHDQKSAHGHYGQGPHDRAHSQPPRSAFARSRYRREPASLNRRSSIYVSGEHGSTYLVSSTSPRTWGNARRGTDRQSSHAYYRRQADESNIAMGRIDIMASYPSRPVMSFFMNRST